MSVLAISQLIGLLARVTSGALTAIELNQMERLPALRVHADKIIAMVAAGRDPTQDEIDALAKAIDADIDFIHQRALDARA